MSDQRFDARSPGEMLRTAREQQGLHIAALAAAIKVAPRKLDALEHDRWDELPDATFVRALAQTVCRTLKIDSAPVLLLLPRAGTQALDAGGAGLNAPFRDRPGRDEPGLTLGAVRPMVLAASLLMIAAVAVYFVPDHFWVGKFGLGGGALTRASLAASSPAAVVAAASTASAPEAAPTALFAPEEAASGGSTAPSAGGLPVATAPLLIPAPLAASVAAPTAARVAEPMPAASVPGAPSLLQLRTTSSSWVEARDAGGRTLLSRVVTPGERVGLEGALPIKLTIGNASATQIDFRGQPFDLAPGTRENVARVELK
jgi:cytoskeleton protein RodZ